MVRRILATLIVLMVVLTMTQIHGSSAAPASTGGSFNPFSVQQVRLAVQYLVNRSYVSLNVTDNSSYPVLGPPSGVYSLLNLTVGGDFNRALSMINNAMDKLRSEGYPLKKIKGVWYYSGKPVIVRLVVLNAYPYKQVGFYVAELLQRAGFIVNKFVMSYDSIYTKVLPSGSGWDVYVGGVEASNFTYPALYFRMRPLVFSNVTLGEMLAALGGNSSTLIKALNLTDYTTGELVKDLNMTERTLLLSVLSGNYSGDLTSLQKLLTALNVFSSNEVSLVRMKSYYAYNSSLDVYSKLGMYAPSGSIIWGPFDPLTRILDPNSAYIWRMMNRDSCNVTFKVGSFKAPSTAVPFSVGENSRETVTYVCKAVNWTNGQPLTPNDFLYYLEFLRVYGGSLYSALLKNVIAFQPIYTNGTVGYTLYLREPGYVSLYEFYPPLPWDVSFAVAQLMSNGSAYGIREKFSLYGGHSTIPINLMSPQTINALKKVIEQLYASGNAPRLLSKEGVNARYSADLNFISKTGNLLIGTGVYTVQATSNDTVTLKSIVNGSEVRFFGFSTPDALLKAFERGEIDGIATPMPKEFYGGMNVKTLLHTNFVEVNDTYVYVFFNTRPLPPLSTSTTSTSSTTSTTHTSTTSTSTTSITSTTSTTSSHMTTSTSSTSSSSSSTSTTSSKKKSICGPAAIVGLALLPLFLRKRKK